MAKKLDHPAKLACLACRATKTRCDGQHPCSKCLRKCLECSYKASRRGGPRRGPRYLSQAKGLRSDAHRPLAPEAPRLLQVFEVGDKNSDSPHQLYHGSQPIVLQPSTPVGFTDLSDVLDGVEPSELTKSSRSTETNKNIQPGPINEGFPVVRSYKSEEDMISPTKPQHDDQPEMIQPRTQDATVFERSIFPHWPSSSLSLAISAILALIPLPQDQTPLSDASISLRRSCAQFYACAALKEAEEEVDELSPGASAFCIDSTQEKFHPDVPPPLHPVLALTILGIFEDCQQGNISRMRNRSNRAITTAMDISLHSLGTVSSEAQRRAWWSVVG
ncbi:hypothetical protein N7449_011380 [Penicillium cf. viridicatum]|uniref:Zn(2)-C6 fungal-type domain-containing protein n=1 Tax=Penicillium cf. viridicatum TaxID=2972119 RepID=A0A9W9J2Y6_9EURO|nr:hypothetical protein N7449_011380 [Penicillium cf. viridicatum]